jgi:RND family efflux transporter MFP subunit
VDVGDSVRAGQILASLDLREIDAGLTKARSGAAKARRDLARARRLYADSVVALAQLQDSETADEVAQADLEAAAVNRRYAVIVAPATGVVLRRTAEPGENISAGAPVVVVGSRGAGHGQVLEIGLSDRDVVAVRNRDPATARFDAMPGREFSGRVSRIGAAADPVTGTYQIEIALDDDELATGLVGRVEIRPARGAPVTLIPIEAMLEADGRTALVYVLSADGTRAERRPVTVAFIAGDRVAIAGGLEGVSRVLTDGAAYLDDDAVVRVTR